MLMTAIARIVMACGLACAWSGAALAQSPDTLSDPLRRLLEGLPTTRLPDSLGLARSGVVATEGQGSVRVRPDTARVRLGVVSEGTSPIEVAQENAKRMASVLDSIKKAIGEPLLAGDRIEIRTEVVTLTPIYAADRGPNQPQQQPAIRSYRGGNSIGITVRDLDQREPGLLASIIEQGTQAGANEISGPEFLVHNDAKPLLEARVNAVEDARTKADTYAKALNVRLGRVLMVNEVNRGSGPMPMLARAASQAEASPPIEAGRNEVAARVTVVWELKHD